MNLFSRRNLLTRLYLRLFHNHFAKDLALELQLEAKRESIAYLMTHMREAQLCGDRLTLHRLALEQVSTEGLYLELGVKSGGSIRDIARLCGKTVHGFDSFEGLPEDWSGTSLRKGRFSRRGRLPSVPRNVRLHRGWFADSLPAFAADHPGPIAFMHVDCDLYSSTRTAFDVLGDRIGSGAVVVFDEYFNYPGWQAHEFKAFQEFVAARGVRYRYLGFVARGGSVAVRIDAVAAR
jgi:hypothetical protein